MYILEIIENDNPPDWYQDFPSYINLFSYIIRV